MLCAVLWVLLPQRPFAQILAEKLLLLYLYSRKENGWARNWSKADLRWKLSAVFRYQQSQGSSVKRTDESGVSAASPVSSLSWGRSTSLGPAVSLKCSWVSWSAVSAASHLTSQFPMRCSMQVCLETLNYVDSSSCFSYNDPRFFSRNVCALQEELVS